MRPLAALSILLTLTAGPLVRTDRVDAMAPVGAPVPREANLSQAVKASTVPSREEGEAAAWREACDEHSPEAYANFLYLYPSGQYAKAAVGRLARVADPGGVRVTDVPFFGATGPFRLDAFLALDGQRHGRPIHVTETLVHSPRGKALQVSLAAVAENGEPAARLAAVDLLFALDELWWFAALRPQDSSRLDQAIVSGLQSLVVKQDTPAAAGAADLLWQLRHERHTEPLLAALKPANSPAMRRAAADILGQSGGPAAVEPLAAALKADTDFPVRFAAAESLGELGDARAIPALAAALGGDQQVEVRLAAAVALRVLGSPRAVEPLAGALSGDKSPIVRWVAACALGTLGDERAVAPLVAALADDDRSVRRAAAETLGALRAPRAVEPLLAVLKAEKTPPLRVAVIDALGAIGDTRAVEPLVDVIKQQRFSGDQPTSTSAALALRAIGDPRAVQLVFAAVDQRDPQVQSSAAFALGILDASPKVLATLAKQHRHRWYRQQGAWPGKRLFDARSVHRLIESLTAENAELRQNSALALGMTADVRAVEPLTAALTKDRQVRVREAAVRALKMIEDPHTLAPLLAALQDASPSVALRAVESVRDVKDPRVVDALIRALQREPPSANPGVTAPPSPEDPLATEDSVRKAVLVALAGTGEARVLRPLAAALSHRSPQLREAAALALGILRNPDGVTPLLAALKDDSSWVREKAATALGMIGDPRAADALLDMLKDQAPEVRDAALRAVALLGTVPQASRIAERLRTAADGSRYGMHYWIALFSLGWRPQRLDDCVRLLAAQDQRIMLLALWPNAKKILLADAVGGDTVAVQRIAELLISLGREESVADLIALLKAKGTKNLAATYFHSGKKELQDAAARWAEDRGRIQLPARQPGNDVPWGSM